MNLLAYFFILKKYLPYYTFLNLNNEKQPYNRLLFRTSFEL